MNAKRVRDSAWLQKGWLNVFFDSTGMTNGKRCKLCGKVVKSTAVATSNFARHLRMYHGDKLAQYNTEAKHGSSVNHHHHHYVECEVTSSINKTRKAEIDSALVEFHCSELEPLDIERSEALQRLLQIAAPDYTMPDHRTISHTLIPRKVEEFKSSVARLVSSCRNVGVTVDVWSSRAAMLFIGVTIHVIPPNMIPETAVLSCKYVPGQHQHSAETISAELKNLFEQTMLTHKVRRVLLESGANIARSFKLPCFESTLRSESEEALAQFGIDSQVDVEDLQSSTFDRVPCAAYMLQLVVQRGVESDSRIGELIGKVSRICSAVRNSSSANLEVHHLFTQFDLTEWNSQFQMINLFLRIVQTAPSVLEQWYPQCTLAQTNDNELRHLAELCDVLAAFDHASKILQSEVASGGALIPTLCALWLHLREKKAKTQYMAAVCGRMMLQLRHLFGNCLHDSMWLTCAVLDPRFRIAFCKPIDGLVDYNPAEIRKIVFTECKKAYEEYSLSSDSQVERHLDDAPEVKPSFFSCVLAGDIDRRLAVSCSDDFALLAQFDSYVCAAVTDCDADIFAYIRSRAMVDFPRLIPAWRKFLCIPATSAPIRCLFSTASDITTENRSRLLGDVLEDLVFIKRNLKLRKRQK